MKKIAAAWTATLIAGCVALQPSSVVANTTGIDYGSGTIGNWQANTPNQSTSTEFFAALGNTNGFYIVGDSIANGTKEELKAMFANHTDSAGHRAWSGAPTVAAADWIEAAAAASGLPKNLLLVSGSNDVFAPPDINVQIDRIMTTAGPTRNVYWVVPNVARSSYVGPDQRNSGLLAIYLYRKAKQYPNLILIDWQAFLSEKPTRIGSYTPDGVHPDVDGTAAFVALVEMVVY